MGKLFRKNGKKCILAVILLISMSANSIFATGVLTDNERTAISALSGNIVYSLNDAKQQRYFKANYIKNLNHDLDTIAIGSSYMLSLSSTDVGNSNFANLAVGAANLQDRINILGLLDCYNIKYNNIILELDMRSFFEGDAFTLNDANNAFNKYGNYFLEVISGTENPSKPSLDFNDSYVNEFDFSKELIKKDYTQYDLDPYMYYYRPDGSLIKADANLLFDDKYKNDTRQAVIAGDKALEPVHMYAKSIDVVSKLAEYFHNKGIKVTFVIAPRSNYCYDTAGLENFSLPQEITALLSELSTRYGYTFRGSFNPYDLGMTEADFDDGFHLNEAAVKKLVSGER